MSAVRGKGRWGRCRPVACAALIAAAGCGGPNQGPTDAPPATEPKQSQTDPPPAQTQEQPPQWTSVPPANTEPTPAPPPTQPPVQSVSAPPPAAADAAPEPSIEEKRQAVTDALYAQIRVRMEAAILERKQLLDGGTPASDERVRSLEGTIMKARDLLVENGEHVADVDPPIVQVAP